MKLDLNSRTRSPRRLAVATTLVAVVVAGPLMSLTPAHATTAMDEDLIRNYGADFSDCGLTAGPTCLFTHVGARIQHEELGRAELNTNTVSADVYLVQLDPFGFTLIASGSTPARIKTESLRSASFEAAVPVSDGTKVKIDLAFTGVGPIADETTTGVPYFAPLCPSGQADGTLRLRNRDATVTGSVRVHGSQEPTTDVQQSPSIFLGQSEGPCL